MTSVERALAALDQIPGDLAAEYARPVLRGRMEQITAHLAGLRSLIAQLPDEEAREADYHGRLLAAHDSGMLQRDAQGHPVNFNHDARERLLHALAERESAGTP